MEGGLGTQHRGLFADCDFFKRDKGILREHIQVLMFKGASQTWDAQQANSLAGGRLGVGGGAQSKCFCAWAFTESEVLATQSCLILCDPMDCSLPGQNSSVHGILQARKLEWAAIPFSRGSSQPRDPTQVLNRGLLTAGRFFAI